MGREESQGSGIGVEDETVVAEREDRPGDHGDRVVLGKGYFGVHLHIVEKGGNIRTPRSRFERRKKKKKENESRKEWN